METSSRSRSLLPLTLMKIGFLLMRVVVQQVEDAVEAGQPYDYILVCVKVIPELYELADVIADVVTPAHTCILLNTTTTIGVEKSLGARFPHNLIVSLVSYAELNQTGAFEFEHLGDSATVWIGTAILNGTIPVETQQDMIESLALTLEAGGVECQISTNILQQQWEKMIG
jgi:ketopantoate reductase